MAAVRGVNPDAIRCFIDGIVRDDLLGGWIVPVQVVVDDKEGPRIERWILRATTRMACLIAKHLASPQEITIDGDGEEDVATAARALTAKEAMPFLKKAGKAILFSAGYRATAKELEGSNVNPSL